MTYRTSLSLAAFVLIALVALPQPVAAKQGFDETTIVTDSPNDFAADGALDLVAVHIAERHRFNVEERRGDDVVNFRFELRNRADTKCGTRIKLELSYTSGGATKQIAGGFAYNFAGQSGCVFEATDITGKTVIHEDGISVVVPKATLGLVDGNELTNIYAISYAVTAASEVAQDVAPHPNNNAPQSAPPTSGLGKYTVQGNYPYVTVTPVSPLNQFSVGGQEIKYQFKLAAHPELRDENIRVRFDVPAGWTVAPSQGTTGADPEGQLTAANDGQPRDFAFSLSASGIAEEGDVVPVGMMVISSRGGLVNVTTLTTVSGAKITDPNITIKLLTPGPFQTGTKELQFTVANLSGPLTNIRLALEVTKAGHRATYDAEGMGDGKFKALVNFKDEGTYTVDAYIASIKPSPHVPFLVQVESGGLAPGPGLPLFLVLAAALVVALRRRD